MATPTLDPAHAMQRAIERAVRLNIAPRYVRAGEYETDSSDGITVYRQSVTISPEGDITVLCRCKGGSHYRDDSGSTCKHAAGVLLRLRESLSELEAIITADRLGLRGKDCPLCDEPLEPGDELVTLYSDSGEQGHWNCAERAWMRQQEQGAGL